MRAIHDASELRPLAIPLRGTEADFDAVVTAARDKRYVLIGEASHGTHEFYRSRAEITKRLVRDHGFCAVAIEGDWPDAYRVGARRPSRATCRAHVRARHRLIPVSIARHPQAQP